MRFLIALSLWLASFASYGQFAYPVSSIPKNLLAKAGAVVRTSETLIQVKGLDEVVFKRKYAITILNEAAKEHANIVFYYDKTSSLRSLKGTIYNEMGLATARFSEKQMQDQSAVDNSSLYADDRVKYFIPVISSYPFTIEYELEAREKQSLSFPSWRPASTAGISVERSSMTFICPEWFKLRYKEFNYDGKVEETTVADTKTYTWRATNIPSYRAEPFSPHPQEYLTSVRFAPEKFAYKGTKGSFSDWNEYGKWMNENLLKGRDHVSEGTKAVVLSLIKGITDPKEKARKIYEYVQSKTRYISVQIGIGGFQPYPASEVDRLGYGDCKGLVNYTKALLKVAGIESYYSIVEAGNFKVDLLPDFADMNQGNHVILCLPFENDTTWLECTSKFSPFGFLGDFTDDRLVVACTPEGGKIMRTSRLEAADSRQIRQAKFQISDDGSLSGSMTTTFEGWQFDNRSTMLTEAPSEQSKKIVEFYPFPNLKVNVLNLIQDKTVKPVIRENIDLNSNSYCALVGGKLHLNLNIVNKLKPIREVSNRTNPVYINRGYYDEDVYTYQLPDSYNTNILPHKKVIEKPFGKYIADISVNGNTLSYKRTMQLNSGSYKAEDYQDLVDFFQAIADADNLKLILDKKI